ncbi:hypothetical protein FHX82_005203 [Amycolatopsis bartoniae]|uniref:hypothetical protein n=1 Tax=Amycolatopsis bartoniae TaxID=941986 RepID=UPI0011911AC2|nr:hypothetical protein [Amycolatopsis bartoniae]MBB2938127.1 hypothetical protein [Amycolatopsis bartoniae]TVS99444.1 hypothetical protein FNH07_34845 [Amycolatopsis bartoniae]
MTHDERADDDQAAAELIDDVVWFLAMLDGVPAEPPGCAVTEGRTPRRRRRGPSRPGRRTSSAGFPRQRAT